MRTAPREPNPFVVVIATIVLLPAFAVLLYYVLDPDLRAWMGWHAAWLLLACAACLIVLGRALKCRWATLRFRPDPRPGRTRPSDHAGPVAPF